VDFVSNVAGAVPRLNPQPRAPDAGSRGDKTEAQAREKGQQSAADAPPSPGTATAGGNATSPGPDTPPPPPPVKSDEDQAKEEIAGVLERYRRAYEARNLAAVQAVYPSFAHAAQWKFIETLKLDKAGEPEIKLDAALDTATVVMRWNRTETNSRGAKSQQLQKFSVQLTKKTANNNWVITATKLES
jgi:hypothetical protein